MHTWQFLLRVAESNPIEGLQHDIPAQLGIQIVARKSS